MPITEVPSGITIPALGDFPLDENGVYEATFSSLDQADAAETPEAPKDGESANSEQMRAAREAAREKRREQRAQAKAEAKAKIKQAIKDQLAEVKTKLSEIGVATKTLTKMTPVLLGEKVWLVAFDITYIKPLEAQVTAYQVVVAMPVDPMAGTASAQAKASMAQSLVTLQLQLDMTKDMWQEMKNSYDADVETLKAAAETINSDLSFISGWCEKLQLTRLAPVSAFLAVFGTIQSTTDATIKVLEA